MKVITLILLLIILLALLPAWPYSVTWGYFPSSIVGIILIVAVILLLTRNS